MCSDPAAVHATLAMLTLGTVARSGTVVEGMPENYRDPVTNARSYPQPEFHPQNHRGNGIQD